ncbi:MAG TPA: efflux RND transporter periplasmic adaptor subunit [Burkholderiaceae bacterium]|jgi:RND family efflux transporter MFP subunit|nr:efflux RND transporter periplasmic adaptor subunit [Burkholderiaceae bacterium]
MKGHDVDQEKPGHSVQDGRVSVEFSADSGRKIKRFALAVAVALGVGFAVVSLLKARERSELAALSKEEANRRPTVVVMTVRAGEGVAPLSLPGETAAWLESTIYSRVNGYVAAWYVDIGDHVRKGQVMALIDTPELDAQLAAAQAQLHASQAQVKVREAEAQFATTTYERWRDSPKGVVSDQEREAKKADYDSAMARLNAARAQVALNQAEVDNITAMTMFKHVTAPFDGAVVERRIDIGNLVTAGSTAATTPLYRVAQDHPMRVFVDVPQSLSSDLLRAGVPVQVHSSALPGKVFSGTVTRTADAINPQARTLKVEVDLPNRERLLIPGMYVEVAFRVDDGDRLLQVPAAALVFRAKGPHVALIDSEGRVRFRKVTIARDQGNVVELGSGVSPGDKVVLNISSLIAEGELVTASESPDAGSNAGLATARNDGDPAH